MGIVIRDKILGIRILVGYDDELVTIWEHKGDDWATKLHAVRSGYEKSYGTLYFQVLREYSPSLTRGENVHQTWIPYVNP